MKTLFDKLKSYEPEYDIAFREVLFDNYSRKGGGSERSKEDKGKQFANNYELYIYAFFLGLYNDEFQPIKDGTQKVSFRYQIALWGNKGNKYERKDFSNVQEYLFIALMAKTDLDLVALEKGNLDEDEAVKSLIRTMEAYTNGGLILLKEKMEENPNYFYQPTSFLDLILEIKNSYSPN
jgi:hypothetical protein